METYTLNYTGEQINSKLDEIDNKQDKLTAGDGIVISEDNVISTTKIYKHHLTCECHLDKYTNFYIFSHSSTPISTYTSLNVGDFIYGVGYHKDNAAIYTPLIEKRGNHFLVAGISYLPSTVIEDEVTPI